MSASNSPILPNLNWPAAPTCDDEPSGMARLVQGQNDWFALVGIMAPTEQEQPADRCKEDDDAQEPK